MSHDIDLIVSHQDLAVLGTKAADISASHDLGGTKWCGTWRSIHFDLYVPYQSRLGANLQLRVEQLQAQAEMLKGYRVLSAPAHTATKIAALVDRPDSLPGRKDRHEILHLLGDPTTASAPTVIALASARSRLSGRDAAQAGLRVPRRRAGARTPGPLSAQKNRDRMAKDPCQCR